MRAGKLLPRVEQRRALEEEEHRGIVVKRPFVLHARADARLVVVFEEAQLVVVVRVQGLLQVEQPGPLVQRRLALEEALEALRHVVLVFDVENVEQLRVAGAGKALAADVVAEARVHALGQPHAVGIDLGDRRARPLPERDRHKGSHVAAEAVDELRPHLQAFDLIVPEGALAVIEVDHVGPVADLVADIPVPVAPVELRMLPQQHGVGGAVVIHHVDHDLHAAAADLAAERTEILHAAVGGVDRAVVAVGVGAAETAFLSFHADGVDRQEPDPVRSQIADAVEVGDDRKEGPLLGVRADVDRIDELPLQPTVGKFSHFPSLLPASPSLPAWAPGWVPASARA